MRGRHEFSRSHPFQCDMHGLMILAEQVESRKHPRRITPDLLVGKPSRWQRSAASPRQHYTGDEVIGVTGYPGAGKSTVVNRLVSFYRRQGLKVGVLAVDISSSVTGGALLGDRIRMQEHALDHGVYIRSMATRGHHGGLAQATGDAAIVLEAAGYDVILIETIGVGQNEVDIVDLAHIVVAVVAPGLGDEVQAMKAGLLEVAHIIIVNKGDLPDADNTLRDSDEMVSECIAYGCDDGRRDS